MKIKTKHRGLVQIKLDNQLVFEGSNAALADIKEILCKALANDKLIGLLILKDSGVSVGDNQDTPVISYPSAEYISLAWTFNANNTYTISDMDLRTSDDTLGFATIALGTPLSITSGMLITITWTINFI